MKWVEWLMAIRHEKSAFNALRERKARDPEYQRFVAAFDANQDLALIQELARRIADRFRLNVSDADTPLASDEITQAEQTGAALRREFDAPHVIHVSPYQRTLLTLEHLKRGWPELEGVEVKEEERIREQEHGLQGLYNDWRVMQALHPEQRLLRAQEGGYWYRYPQGENVPDVRQRLRDWIGMLIREYAGKRVLAIKHHLTLLALRANFERLGVAEFLRLDQEEKPINAGVTLYRGEPGGRDGRLKLDFYNRKYWT